MVRGIETTIKMRLKPNLQAIDEDYILGCILKLSVKESFDLVPAAKKILRKIGITGDEGLFSADWAEAPNEFEITQSQYFFIINRLKMAGLINKSKGKFYLEDKFEDHLRGITDHLKKLSRDWRGIN